MAWVALTSALFIVSQSFNVELPKAFTNGLGIDLVLVPSGEFLMGSVHTDHHALEDERPHHKVYITKAFYIGATEVTQQQYVKVMNSTPSRMKGKTRPIDNVSWSDAIEFCRRLSEIEGRKYRLPTEAEWEYACRAGSKTRFNFGNDSKRLTEFAWFRENSGGETHTVGTKKPNDWGLYDMHGNVMEWCSDAYRSNYYHRSPTDDPRGSASESADRVCRGGNFALSASNCRSTARFRFPEEFRTYQSGWMGIRVVCEHEDPVR